MGFVKFVLTSLVLLIFTAVIFTFIDAALDSAPHDAIVQGTTGELETGLWWLAPKAGVLTYIAAAFVILGVYGFYKLIRRIATKSP